MAIAVPANVSAHACMYIWMGPACGPCDGGSGLDDVIHFHFKASEGPLNYDCFSVANAQQENTPPFGFMDFLQQNGFVSTGS